MPLPLRFALIALPLALCACQDTIAEPPRNLDGAVFVPPVLDGGLDGGHALNIDGGLDANLTAPDAGL